MRTFLALRCSVGATRRIAEAMEQRGAVMRDGGLRVAWIPPAKYHVTLKFFGEIPGESLDAITLALRRRVAKDRPAPMTVSLKGLGVFPADGPARVLWVGVDGGKPLAELQRAVDSEMAELGFPRAEHPFHPHLTVGRVVEGTVADWSSDADFGEDTIGEIVVYESQLQQSHRTGAEYLARARVPFTKA